MTELESCRFEYIDMLAKMKLNQFLDEMERFSIELMADTEQTEREGIAVSLYDKIKAYRASERYLMDYKDWEDAY